MAKKAQRKDDRVRMVAETCLQENRRVGIKDIAVLAGCSPRAVSSALRGTPGVSEELRTRIRAIAQQLNYSPNIMARGLVRSRTYLVGVMLPRISASFFADILQGITDRCEDDGCSIILASSGGESARMPAQLDQLLRRGVDGIAVLVELAKSELYAPLKSVPVPYVQLIRRATGLDGPGVFIDDEEGAYIATRHLIARHGKRPLHIAGPLHKWDYPDRRVKGFLRALKEAGMDCKGAVVERGASNWEHGRAAVVDLVREKRLPRSIFAVNDFVALGAMRAAYELGIGVPGQLAVVGYDDLDIAGMQWAGCGLTTMRQPKYLLGELAAQMLLARIRGEEVQPVQLRPELVVRGSCGG